MKNIILLLILTTNSFAQDIIPEKENLLKNEISKKLKSNVVARLKLNSYLKDSINVFDYTLSSLRNNFDFNGDSKKDMCILLNLKNEKKVRIKPQFAKTSRERILVLLKNNGEGNFETFYSSSRILNQNTEGRSSPFQFNVKNNEISINEFGSQAGTDWATGLKFIFNKTTQKLIFKEAIAYKAESVILDPVIKNIVFKKDLNANEQIERINYYDYFAFGFTDEFP